MKRLFLNRFYITTLLILLVVSVVFLVLLKSYQSSSCNTDPIDFKDSIEEKGKTYYLSVKQTGFQDKVYYFELYDSQPKFDECGKPIQKPFYSIHYEDYPNYPDKEQQYIKSMILQVDQNEKLNIIYTMDKNEGMSIYEVKFTMK